MKKMFLPILIMCLPILVQAQNINGRITSSVYAFQRFSLLKEGTTFFRGYQTINLNVNKKNFSFRTGINLESDYVNRLQHDPRLRFYNLYFEARKLFNIATVRIGRQPLFNSVAGGLFDGAYLRAKYSGIIISGFYGGNVPAYQKLGLTNSWKNDFVLGGKIKVNYFRNFSFGVSYIDKNFKPEEYWTTRLDSLLNPIKYLIRRNSNQYKFVSGEASYYLRDVIRINSRFDYDLNFQRASKFEISARYDQIKNLGIEFYYNYREPRISYNSIFSVFNYGNTQEIEAGLDYRINPIFTVIGKFANVQYRDASSQRFTVGVNSNYGSFIFRKTFGYAGELDALSLSTAHSFLDGLLTPSIGLSYTGYKLSKNSPKQKIIAFLIGTNIRPWRMLSFDIQGQYFNNKIYKNDFRVFFKINYWFNTNLKQI